MSFSNQTRHIDQLYIYIYIYIYVWETWNMSIVLNSRYPQKKDFFSWVSCCKKKKVR